MIPQSLLLDWVRKACNLHPDTREFDAVKIGEFDYVARCAYQLGKDSFGLSMENEANRCFKNGYECGIMFERDRILTYANSHEFNRMYGEFSPKAYDLTNWIERTSNAK